MNTCCMSVLFVFSTSDIMLNQSTGSITNCSKSEKDTFPYYCDHVKPVLANCNGCQFGRE